MVANGEAVTSTETRAVSLPSEGGLVVTPHRHEIGHR